MRPVAGLLAIIVKDLRLLWRDRAGLIFLTIAPVMVITVAGFSLANLYGADPTGQTAYEFPFADEDGSPLAQRIRERLAQERALRLRPVTSRAEAEAMVRRKQAGTALVVPKGTAAALAAGQPAALILYTDSVKYLERLNVMARLLEMRDALAGEQRARVSQDASGQRAQLEAELAQLRAAAAAARAQLEATWAEAKQLRDTAAARARSSLERAQQNIRDQAAAVRADADAELNVQRVVLQDTLREYFDGLAATRKAFESWFARLREAAGSRASDIPPPPKLPQVPAALQKLLNQDEAPLRLPTPAIEITLPAVAVPELPPLPEPPEVQLPEIALPPAPPAPTSLGIEEINATGGPLSINTFDQNVPGFSVTFLLLGMLLGVSLGLLDERDWGTLERLHALPIPRATVLVGKLLSRFLVGVAQMLVLFAMGRLVFDVSLGPQPWALLLPIVGIVFAGTAFGLIVAAMATSREAVLPLGSIVIVTMAAVGGCWWPIDLEPRWMRTVALAFPTTWAMDAFNDLMIRRRSVDVALLPTAVMLAYGSVYLGLGLLLFRRRLNVRR
jgi:ABC-type multidrug transport system permease subunit